MFIICIEFESALPLAACCLNAGCVLVGWWQKEGLGLGARQLHLMPSSHLAVSSSKPAQSTPIHAADLTAKYRGIVRRVSCRTGVPSAVKKNSQFAFLGPKVALLAPRPLLPTPSEEPTSYSYPPRYAAMNSLRYVLRASPSLFALRRKFAVQYS